jgi:hypothetical protein
VVLASNGLLFPQSQEVTSLPFANSLKDYWPRWDPVGNTLIFFRDTEELQGNAVFAYDEGRGKTLELAPLKDFPDAKGLDIWSAAATPEGGVVLSVVVQDGGLNTRFFVLTYDVWGLLQKMWEVYPYHHHHQLAVDRKGNVYGFGHREDRGEEAGEKDYPLLVKYSPQGKILWTALPRSQFPYGREVVVTDSNSGIHSMFLIGDFLVLYLATTQEVLRLDSMTGQLNGRHSLSRALAELAQGNGGTRAEILCLAAAGDGYFAQFRLWREGKEGRAIIGFVLASIAGDGSQARPNTAATPGMEPGLFLGIGRGDRQLYLTRSGNEVYILRHR